MTVYGFPDSQSTGSETTCVAFRIRFTYPSGCSRLTHASMRVR